MGSLPHLFDNNRRWAEGVTAVDADFFSRLVQGAVSGLAVDRLLR